MRVMEVMGKTERPDSEDCKGQRGESGTEEEIWRGGEDGDGGEFITVYISVCVYPLTSTHIVNDTWCDRYLVVSLSYSSQVKSSALKQPEETFGLTFRCFV